MGNLWTWLKDEANRKVLGWVIAGLGSVAIYFGFTKPYDKKANPPATSSATSHGGNAVNASGNAQVSIGTASSTNVAASNASAVAGTVTSTNPAAQSAVANGGNAINASGNAQVNVK
jgi:hypothetical protein